MEMTIEKAISHLGTYSSTMGSGQTTQAQHEDAKRVAIATMRKYQKIAEIVTNNELEWGNTSVRANALLEVKKVVEDGAENNHHASNA